MRLLQTPERTTLDLEVFFCVSQQLDLVMQSGKRQKLQTLDFKAFEGAACEVLIIGQ
jgi:hypothetical protein